MAASASAARRGATPAADYFAVVFVHRVRQGARQPDVERRVLRDASTAVGGDGSLLWLRLQDTQQVVRLLLRTRQPTHT